MSHAAIIEALGGAAKVARLLGVHETRPIHWRRDGIPPRHFAALIKAAAADGVDGVTLDALAGSSVHAPDDNASGLRKAQHVSVSNHSNK